MKQLFLYRLLKHSFFAFALVIIFLCVYAVTFYKKMDMIFFPYNNMYAIDFNKANTATTYALKIDAIPVNITKNLYWKKDFLETSLNAYCTYIKNGNNLFLDEYIKYRFQNEQVRTFLINKLTPDKIDTAKWLFWYANAAGYAIQRGATVELMQYDFSFENGTAFLKDSITIYKSILP